MFVQDGFLYLIVTKYVQINSVDVAGAVHPPRKKNPPPSPPEERLIF
jgi:hypothetical protein